MAEMYEIEAGRLAADRSDAQPWRFDVAIGADRKVMVFQ